LSDVARIRKVDAVSTFGMSGGLQDGYFAIEFEVKTSFCTAAI
jgi:hypothetical protein